MPVGEKPDLLATHDVFLIRRCSYSPSGGFSEIHTDVVLMDPGFDLLGFSPFHMAALRLIPTNANNYNIGAYPLIPTDDVDLVHTAGAAAHPLGLKVRQCYVLGKPTKATLPPSQGKERNGRSDFSMKKLSWWSWGDPYLLDNSSLILRITYCIRGKMRSMAYYLNFS
ncbi:hypothetical protein BJX99DRAFT_256591 [Aspergillus californicus]